MKEESVGMYLSGFADGEGSFCVSFNRSKRHRFGWEIRPSFSVSQNRNRSKVLMEFKKYLHCGSIRPDRSDNTLKYEVRSIKDLVEKVIPHFKRYPLMSEKNESFQYFSTVCWMMYNKLHLTETGFKKVVELAFKVNPNGKKKFSISEIKI